MGSDRLYCTFYVGQQYYGISVREVQEVLVHQPLTSVPLAPPALAGLMNLRGQIITTLDLRKILLTGEQDAGHEPINVVVRHDGAEISLLVDRIGDVIHVGAAAMEPPPTTLQESTRQFLAGIFPLAQDLLLVLDVDHMLAGQQCIRPHLATE